LLIGLFAMASALGVVGSRLQLDIETLSKIWLAFHITVGMLLLVFINRLHGILLYVGIFWALSALIMAAAITMSFADFSESGWE